MDFVTFGGLISLLINSAMGAFVFLKNKTSPVNRYFGLFALCIALWSAGSFLANIFPDPSRSLIILRVCYGAAVFLPSFYLHFILNVTSLIERKRAVLKLAYFGSAVLLCLLASNLFIPAVRPVNSHFFISKPGPVYVAFVFFFNFCTVLGLLYLFRSFREAKGKQRVKLGWMFFAQFIAQVAGLEYFAAVFSIWDHQPVDDFILIGHFSLMSYAIVRHRLLDIDVIIKKTLVFAGIVASSVLAVSTPIGVIQMVIGRAVGISPFLLLVSGIAVAVLAYRPLERRLVNLTDRFLFQKKVDYRLLLKEATEYLAHLDSLKKQARRIIAFLLLKARIRNASIYAFQSYAPGSLLLQASKPPLAPLEVKPHKTISLSHPIANYLRTHRHPIDFSQMEGEKKQQKSPKRRDELDAIIELMKDHKAEAAIPCYGSDAAERARRSELHLRGILFLGPQKSDEPYREEDLDVFFTLGQESSIAFENARLFDEAVQRAQELQAINQELNDAQTSLLRALHDAEKSRKEAEHSREEALDAKRKTEEMELELVRREKLLFVEKLVKGLAHEIFNPLQPLKLQLYLMRRAYRNLFLLFDDLKAGLDFETRRKYYAEFKVIKEGTDLLSLGHNHIKDVVDTLTQMQQRDETVMRPFDLKAFWKIAHPMMAMETHGETLTEIPVDFHISKELPLVYGNPTQLTQVFINLFRNAQAAMNSRLDKKISIVAGVDPADNNFVRLDFSDNGSGIPPDILPKIFDFGFTTKGEKGQGIGLNQCKAILENFNGSLSCESEVGKGSTFIIRLRIWKWEGQNAPDYNTHS